MRKLVVITTSLLIAAAAAGCAGGYYDHRSGYTADVDVYYDGYYGPYSGGYWDGDVFWYSDSHGRHVRDEGHHFRHGSFEHAERFRSGRNSDRHDRDDDHQHP